MSYQVLARKWRPRTFGELVGQSHVVTALVNALSQGRLHHAYLLTGTRGVGKTTLARILAKSLNCERGVSATPCGECGACVAIDGGRFVDLLELDAASNTGVDNMREILDNARYAPTAGRYKVYLIDEVHMLSKPAFNSMLKTLEEPPEHVKFVLATTDPQKIPVTVLSRCLQFNLKPLAPARITARLATILDAESVPHDPAALVLLAAAATGSLRDALSLLDQAIVHGGGSVSEAGVRDMLGVVDRAYVWRLAEAVADGDGERLLAEVSAMAERGLSFDSALQELASLWHRIAIAQVLPHAFDPEDADAARVRELAARVEPEAVQLHYQIALQGRNDLPLAPDEQTGFQMTLLRMLAFEPVPSGPPDEPSPPSSRRAAPVQRVSGAVAVGRSSAVGPTATVVGRSTAVSPIAPEVGRSSADPPAATVIADWPALVAGLGLAGMTQQLASQSELAAQEPGVLVLRVAEAARHLCGRQYVERLREAVSQALGRPVRVRLEVASAVASTLAEKERRERSEVQQQAERAFRDDPVVRDLLDRFDARIRPDSVKPISS